MGSRRFLEATETVTLRWDRPVAGTVTPRLRQAARAILGVVAGGDFDEFGAGVGEALGAVADGVPRLESAVVGGEVEIGGEAGDGVEFFAFLVGGGDALEKGAGVGVARVAEEFGGGGGLDDAAGIHDVDDFAVLGDDGEVVGDEDAGGAEVALAILHEVEDLLLDGDVESGGGFVGDEEFGLGDEGHGDHDALTHAAGEFVRVGLDAIFGIGDADGIEGFDGEGEGVAEAHAFVDFERLGELFGDLQVGIQAGHGILKDHGDAVAADFAELLLGKLEEVDVVEEGLATFDSARRLRDEAEEGVTGNGLAGTGFADDADGLAFLDAERDVLGGVDDAIAGVEAGGEVLDVEKH